MTPHLTLYTLTCCPHCVDLKEALAQKGCNYCELRIDITGGIAVEGEL